MVPALAIDPAFADPWAMAGDLALRHDVQLLADSGVLDSPVTSWPIPWATLAADLDLSESVQQLRPEILAARTRLLRRLDTVRGSGGLQPNAKIGMRSEDFWLRTFEDTPRDDYEVRAGVSWMGDRYAARAQFAFVPDPLPDDQEWRADGSYLAGIFGNHIVSVGALDRWWGPAWDDTLILSNNARPVGGFALERNVALPFENKWLSWAGPWTYSFLWGFLGSDREIPNARLMALRIGFRPTIDLEIGLSRTAVWCGSGRPCDADTIWNIVIGQDNQGEAGLTAEDEPSDQMFAWDARWKSPLGDAPYAIYTQWVAEDEADNLPSQWFGQGGIEVWGTRGSGFLPGAWRAHLELTNTLAAFWEDVPRYDSAYNHGIYRSGHRFERRSMGAAMDGDSLGVSLGAALIEQDGRIWNATLRWAELNTDGVGGFRNAVHSVAPQELRIMSASVSHRREINVDGLSFGVVTLGGGIQHSKDGVTGDTATDLQGFVQWTWDLSGL
jgi:hypothetical protein